MGKKAGLALLCDSLANELIVALDFTVRYAHVSTFKNLKCTVVGKNKKNFHLKAPNGTLCHEASGVQLLC